MRRCKEFKRGSKVRNTLLTYNRTVVKGVTKNGKKSGLVLLKAGIGGWERNRGTVGRGRMTNARPLILRGIQATLPDSNEAKRA